MERKLSLHEQVERWGAEARRLAETGREVAALDLYRQAADAMPGAPWLQQRTAELARKLRQNEVAISYYLRSSAAFIGAGFAKRAVAPLRAAWTTAREGLPRSAAQFTEITGELARVQRRLGLLADASVTIEYANDAFRRFGLPSLPELQDDVLEAQPRAASR